jgi:1-acyl-sn-glycerol-3-phosphate acyltransferase
LPVVPVSLAGTRHVMKKGRLMVQPAEVELTIHPPIPTAGVSRNDVIPFAERVRTIVAADAR